MKKTKTKEIKLNQNQSINLNTVLTKISLDDIIANSEFSIEEIKAVMEEIELKGLITEYGAIKILEHRKLNNK